jgi:hypothetical protein
VQIKQDLKSKSIQTKENGRRRKTRNWPLKSGDNKPMWQNSAVSGGTHVTSLKKVI